MEKKEKKHIAPNECSFGRWIAVLLVGILISNVLSLPIFILVEKLPAVFMGISAETFRSLLMFVPLFWGMVIALKLVGKTSVKDFVLGVGGKVNIKECLIVLGLLLAGFAIHLLPFFDKIRVQDVKAGEFAFLLVFVLLVSWMQTTCEEFIFRGFLLRWACKNKIGFTKKSAIVAVVTSLAFALVHAGNPEVTSQGGIHILMAIFAYAIPGMAYFLADLYFGSLLPGILLHWINNTLLFTLISGDVAAIPLPTLLLDTSPHSASGMLISAFLVNLPTVLYIVFDAGKKKKAAATAEISPEA